MIKNNYNPFYLQPPTLSQKHDDFESTDNTLKTEKNLYIKRSFYVTEKEFYTGLGQRFGRTGFSTLLSGSLYTASAIDYLIGVTNLSYAPTIGLPQPKLVGPGKTYIIKDEAGGAATTTITIVSTGYETIDGGANTTLTTNYQSKQFYSDGAAWYII